MRPAQTLIALVREVVDEPVGGLSDTIILASLNEALGLFAERFTPTTLLVPFEEIDLDANENFVRLPDNCITQRVISVHNSERRPLKIFKRIADAAPEFAKNRTPGKDPDSVLVSNNGLRLIPEVSQPSKLYLSYVRTPDIYSSVSDNGSGITFLPAALGEKLLVNYAAAAAYRMIEDGVTDSKGNFGLYTSLANQALEELERFFGPEAKQYKPETLQGADDIVFPRRVADPFFM
jgi:hypothetical protein